jgi:hypothetical protein
MASVTVERLAMAQARILYATDSTSENSTLPIGAQDELLAETCADACQLLGDWLVSGWFQQAQPEAEGLLADALPTSAQFTKFLGPIFASELQRISERGIQIDVGQLEQARAGVAALARRHRRLKPADLFPVAEKRVQALTREVCQAASLMKKAPAASRHKARRALKKVAAFLPTVALTVGGAMLSAGPAQMEQSVSAWVHDAAQVVVVYHLADLAQPGIRISPPSAGPRVGA